MRKSKTQPLPAVSIPEIRPDVIARFEHNEHSTATTWNELMLQNTPFALMLKRVAIAEGGDDMHERELILRGMMLVVGALNMQSTIDIRQETINTLEQLFALSEFLDETVPPQQ